MRATSRDALFCGFPSFLQSVHEHPCIWPYMSALSFVFQVSHFGCAEAYTHHLLFRAPWMRLYMQHVQHVNTHIKTQVPPFPRHAPCTRNQRGSIHSTVAGTCVYGLRFIGRAWTNRHRAHVCWSSRKLRDRREGANKEKVGGGEETSVQAPEALICRGRI